MDESPHNEEISNTSPAEEPIAEEMPKEETEVIAPAESPEEVTSTEELKDEPEEEKPVEEAPAEGIADEPAPEKETETREEATKELKPEETPEEEPKAESLEEKPEGATPTETSEEAIPADEPKSEAAEPSNPELIASAEAETPAEQAPVFPAETEPKPKSKKPLIIALIAFLVLALGGTGVWYFLLRDKGAPETAVQNDVETVPDLEPLPANKLALRGNDLSDFDLAFLRLENKQDNVIYSPLSIKYALAMLADGANGESKDQITAVIGDYKPKAYINSENRSLANAMFIRTDFTDQVKQTFKDTLESKYNASVILDPFTSPDNANQWVEDKTLGIIKNTFDSSTVNPELDYMLVNALAIDMKWVNQLQCARDRHQETNSDEVPCKFYSIRYAHENYTDFVPEVYDINAFDKITFNNHEEIKSAKIGASINRYDIIKELGEDYIRSTVRAEYEKYVEENKDHIPECTDESTYCEVGSEDTDTYLDKYMEALASNYGKDAISTDFSFIDNDAERIFAKDLQEYDGSTLQYVGIMPKTSSLNAYINSLTAEKATSLIANLKDVSDINNFKDGVVTKITAHIPFFKFNFTMEDLTKNLQELGITNVFSTNDADLSNMIEFDSSLSSKPYISTAIHKADIDFSNDGIKAAAVTAFGGMGAGGDWDYLWDVPVEEIDLTFDKPFLFLIRDKDTGEVWFTGTVYNPAN